MMLAMNGMSSVIMIILALSTGEALEFISFIRRHTDVIQHLVLLMILGGLGQIFIFYTLYKFGALPCAIVTTLRKFFTILFSVIFLGNPLQLYQWIGTVIVFVALFGDILLSKKVREDTKINENGNHDV